LTDRVFREMAKAHPKVSPMRELRSALSEMRLSDLAVGSDGRNRTILSTFQSRSGRIQPSNAFRAQRMGQHVLPALGGLRHALKDSTNTGWRNKSFRDYADYTQTEAFAEALASTATRWTVRNQLTSGEARHVANGIARLPEFISKSISSSWCGVDRLSSVLKDRLPWLVL